MHDSEIYGVSIYDLHKEETRLPFLFPFTTLAFITTCLCVIYALLKYKLTYWQRHKMPQLPLTLLLGNMKNLLLLRSSFGDFFQQLYAYPQLCAEPVVGIYVLHTPALLIRDPDLVRVVLVKEFNMFLNRYETADSLHDSMGALSMPLSKYPVWRESRKKISELFTSGRLKETIYPNLKKIAKNLEDYIERRVARATDSSVIIEVKEMCALFTTDSAAALVLSSGADGLKNDGSDIRQECRDLLQPNFIKLVHFFTIFFLPHLINVIRPKVFSQKYTKYMRRLVKTMVKMRERSPTRNDSDLIDLLMAFQKDSVKNGHQLHCHSDFIASQAAIFILAGFETSSSLLAFILYELTKQPHIQEKLRSELRLCFQSQRSSTGCLSYEQISEMKYLNMIVAEGLRLYPTAPFINRECVAPATEHRLFLKPLSNFTIPTGMPAYISILGLHRDPKYWPNPSCFDPERFSPEKINVIHPMTYLPFGGGPRGCIGSRLGLLQVKVGLAHILKDYRVEVCSRTVPEIRFDPNSFMLQAQGGLYLRFCKDN